MAEPSADDTKLLEEIRREIIEARNMTIKTDNALKTLHAELKTVSTQQEAFQRRTWFSSGVAYLVFAGLCLAGAVAVSQVRDANASSDQARLEKSLGEFKKTIDQLKAESAETAAAMHQAQQVYQAITSLPGDERLKGLDALAKLDQQKLSPFVRQVLQDRAELLRREIGSSILEKGKAAFRKQDWNEAAAQLSRFIGMTPPQDELVEASFFLGNALFQLRKFSDAIGPLTRFIEGDKKARTRDFAMVLLMQAHDMVGNREQGLAVAKEALSSYPNSDFRPQLAGRVQRGAVAASAPSAAPSSPAAPPQAPRSPPGPSPQ